MNNDAHSMQEAHAQAERTLAIKGATVQEEAQARLREMAGVFPLMLSAEKRFFQAVRLPVGGCPMCDGKLMIWADQVERCNRCDYAQSDVHSRYEDRTQ